MVHTIEPGICIPEEQLGVRIEDDGLITESGYKLLSARLPRDPDEIEKIMAAAAKERPRQEKSADRGSSHTVDDSAEIDAIKNLIAKYAKSVDGADTALAAQVWLDSPDVSSIRPLGRERSFEPIQQHIDRRSMGETLS